MNKQEKIKIKRYKDKLLRTYNKITSSPYKYKNRVHKLSFDETLLIEMTVKDLKGKDGEISSGELRAVWLKMKKRIKKDLQCGGHYSKLLQIKFLWNLRDKYFADLVLEERGLFNKLLRMWENRYSTLTIEDGLIMIKKVLSNFEKI